MTGVIVCNLEEDLRNLVIQNSHIKTNKDIIIKIMGIDPEFKNEFQLNIKKYR